MSKIKLKNFRYIYIYRERDGGKLCAKDMSYLAKNAIHVIFDKNTLDLIEAHLLFVLRRLKLNWSQ